MGCDGIPLLKARMQDLMDALCNIQAIIPTGLIIPYAAPETPDPPYQGIPSGWLLCDGSEVSRTTFINLFGVIGETFGAGDTTTTFNLPDLRGRDVLGADNMGGSSANRVTATQADNLGQGSGAETHTLTIPEMPAHTHDDDIGLNGGAGPDRMRRVGDFTVSGVVYNSNSTGSGGAHNNVSPYLTTNYLIKA
jgi:microcystin-dependent protein